MEKSVFWVFGGEVVEVAVDQGKLSEVLSLESGELYGLVVGRSDHYGGVVDLGVKRKVQLDVQKTAVVREDG